MKIISWNVNGLRAVERKGELQKFLKKFSPDIILWQETKAAADQLSSIAKKYAEYEQFYNSAEKAGYAGTGIWLKKRLRDHETTRAQGKTTLRTGMPDFADTEGRISRIDFDEWTILSAYFPNGGKSDAAWDEKILFYEKFLAYVNSLRSAGRKVLWGGDVNCAHEEIDIARPRENENSIGFLPEERAWVTKVIRSDWADAFRSLHPTEVVYSWWHVISRARARNVGWRIDYFFLDKKLMPLVQSVRYLGSQMGSDHCPVEIEIGS